MRGDDTLHSSSVFRLIAPKRLIQQENTPELQMWKQRTEVMVFTYPTRTWELSCP